MGGRLPSTSAAAGSSAGYSGSGRLAVATADAAAPAAAAACGSVGRGSHCGSACAAQSRRRRRRGDAETWAWRRAARPGEPVAIPGRHHHHRVWTARRHRQPTWAPSPAACRHAQRRGHCRPANPARMAPHHRFEARPHQSPPFTCHGLQPLPRHQQFDRRRRIPLRRLPLRPCSRCRLA